MPNEMCPKCGQLRGMLLTTSTRIVDEPDGTQKHIKSRNFNCVHCQQFVRSEDKIVWQQGPGHIGSLVKNRFVVEELIGTGQLCDVYRALDLRRQEAQAPNPYVALKVLRDEFQTNVNAFIAFVHGAIRACEINHPNVATVFDFDKQGDMMFVTMPLMDGCLLENFRSKHPHGDEDVMRIVDGVCQGLICVHDSGIVHLDISPRTIFYTTKGVAKLIDFSYSREIGGASEIDEMIKTLSPLTDVYSSLELLADEEPSPADDVFSLALVIHELLSGGHPYDRLPANDALEKGIQPDRVSQLSDRQWQGLAKGLALKRTDRLQTVNELHRAIFG